MVAADAMAAEVDAAVAAVVDAVVGMEAALAGMEAAEASALEAADAEASALEAAEVVAAEAVEAAGELAWYGHLCGPGAAGVSLHLRPRYLPSRRSNPPKQQMLWEKVT